MPQNQQSSFWSAPASEVRQQLQTTPRGLTGDEAGKRLKRYGSNLLKPKKRSDAPTLLLAQFKGPITLILIFAGGLSFFVGDAVDALIIIAIILVGGLLGFWQERGAANAVEELLAIVQTKGTVIRDGNQKEIPVEEIVPGDIIVVGPRRFYRSYFRLEAPSLERFNGWDGSGGVIAISWSSVTNMSVPSPRCANAAFAASA